MFSLFISLASQAAPLTCDAIQEMQQQSRPKYAIQRAIQQNGIEENVPKCSEKKSLADLIPTPDQDSIAPDVYTVRFQTTKGDFLATFERAWSPLGNDRFYTLVQEGFFQDIAFFRAIRGFMIQFGIHNDPQQNQKWGGKPILDDASVQSNARGYITFAMAGPKSRTSQLFINTNNNSNLDSMGFTPIGAVLNTPTHKGMETVDKIFTGYGEGHPSGRGPSQELLQNLGNSFLREHYPYLDYLESATICRNEKAQSPSDCNA